jgi:hypothetical protein
VYVDGKELGVIRPLELPSGLTPHRSSKRGDWFYEYSLGEYVRALGIDQKGITAVHVYGGPEVALVSGDEFRRVGDRIFFAFSQGLRGRPRLIWPEIRANTTFGRLDTIAIYVSRAAPPSTQNGDLYWADGTKVDGVPYADAPFQKGTRVYRDGRLVATLKRRALPADLLLEGEITGRYSLAGYLTAAGASPFDAETVDLAEGDDVVARLGAADLVARDGAPLSFSLPPSSGGRALVDLPDGDRVRLSAVFVFSKGMTPTRTVVPASQRGDEAPARDDDL